MAIQIFINGVERTDLILWKSVTWEQALTYEIDLITFSLQKFGSRTFEPVVLDDIELRDNSVNVFTGNIVSIEQRVGSVNRLIYKVVVKDNSHVMDRLLVQDQYEGIPVINIINDIRNKYINKGLRIEIAEFENNEIWDGGTVDTVNFRDGSQGRKLTSTNGSVETTNRELFLDLTQNSLTTADYHDIDVFVDDVANLSQVVLKLGDVALLNFFSANITSQLVTGWNQVRVQMSAFSITGTPDWADIDFQELEVVSQLAVTVEVTLDNWEAISASAFTRDNSFGATQTVEFISFNFESPSECFKRLAELFGWQWYVDEDRDIRMFPIFEESTPFNLTDTGGNYIYNSLVLNTNADQLRNSIFVRGGTYLGATITESLTEQIDGASDILKVGYKYEVSTVILDVDATEVAVGTDNIDTYEDSQGITQAQSGLAQLQVGDVAANEQQAQQIICEKKGRREKIKMRIRKVGAPVDNFTLELFDDTNDEPSSPTLSNQVTLAGGSITTSFVEYEFVFTDASVNSLLLSIDDKYHIVAGRSGGADAANYYEIDVFADVYNGRELTFDGSVWTSAGFSWFFVEILGFEVLYNPDDKIMTFQVAPTGGSVVELDADPTFAVRIHYKDNSSISQFGEFQHKIIDKSIKTQEGGRQRALEEILQWANEVSEVSYRTYQSGLRVGQTQNIQSTIRGLNLDVIITKVTAISRTPETFEYVVTCVTTKTMGILYWLQQQISKDDREIVIDETELLNKIEGVNDSFSFSDAIVSTLYDGKVWSNDAGTTPDKLVWDGGVDHIWV